MATSSDAVIGRNPIDPGARLIASPLLRSHSVGELTGLVLRRCRSAASDNVALRGYRVYRNGSLLTTTTAVGYTDSAVARSSTYRYGIRAYDAAGNVGSASSTVSVTTKRR